MKTLHCKRESPLIYSSTDLYGIGRAFWNTLCS